MAFARAVGEYGSVIFIAGNMPMVSEITPLIIIGKLEQYDYAGATAVAVVMLVFSFAMLLINALQAWQRRHSGAPHDDFNAALFPVPGAGRHPGGGAAGLRLTAPEGPSPRSDDHRVARALDLTVRCLHALFLLLPLAAVFTEALRKGWAPTWTACASPMPGRPSS
jgi:ABC-type sulfate transport system permease component